MCSKDESARQLVPEFFNNIYDCQCALYYVRRLEYLLRSAVLVRVTVIISEVSTESDGEMLDEGCLLYLLVVYSV